ncbi:MAG: thioredoxin fold domain-containing protein [Gammaproteobacteria bacterium]|nr:thioredoxin fold domain-containing protein [Gammaproteobacteria bacterium]MBU1724900.1 thioredoxin fold domain-containing protein [Gammaproteobacteria bacterium]MBU2004896.1 thioredoxin fold domain-containing protein [Gammaproteobacteria bacterium]
MTPQPRTLTATLLLWLLMLTTQFPALAEEQIIEEASDFQSLQQEMLDEKLPLLLAFRADYCDYCAQLEREYLEPMIKSGDYAKRILIRRFSMGKSETVTDFNGDRIDADEFSHRHKASLTPTLVFLNAQGEEVAERLLGYNSPDFYGAYLENAIDAAYKAVNNEK